LSHLTNWNTFVSFLKPNTKVTFYSMRNVSAVDRMKHAFTALFQVMDKLRILFTGYAEMPPTCFVFCGNFSSQPYGNKCVKMLKGTRTNHTWPYAVNCHKSVLYMS